MRLLLSYARADSRKLVRLTALRELLHTATKLPHTWTKEMIEVHSQIGGRGGGREGGGRRRRRIDRLMVD